MRRLLRWCFSPLCLLSLLVCLSTAWLWWRCARRDDAVSFWAGPCTVSVASRPPGLHVVFLRGWPGGHGLGPRFLQGFWRTPDDRLGLAECAAVAESPTRVTGGGRLLGFEFEAGRCELFLTPDGSRPLTVQAYRYGAATRPSPGPPPAAVLTWAAFTAPHGAAASATALPPLLWLARRSQRHRLRHRRRLRLGRCPRCGYDLTGNTSGRCSECGDAVAVGRGAA